MRWDVRINMKDGSTNFAVVEAKGKEEAEVKALGAYYKTLMGLGETSPEPPEGAWANPLNWPEA